VGVEVIWVALVFGYWAGDGRGRGMVPGKKVGSKSMKPWREQSWSAESDFLEQYLRHRSQVSPSEHC
jgi:hypothetical protein